MIDEMYAMTILEKGKSIKEIIQDIYENIYREAYLAGAKETKEITVRLVESIDHYVAEVVEEEVQIEFKR